MNEMLRRLNERRTEAIETRKAILDRAEIERRANLTATETKRFDTLTREIREYDDRIADLRAQAEHTATGQRAAAKLGLPVSGTSAIPRGSVYNPETRSSFFADLASVTRGGFDPEARQRIETFANETRALSVGGNGSDFAVPQYLVDEWVGVPRSGRVTADLLDRRPLPSGTNQLVIPRLTSGSTTAIQATELAAISNTDADSDSITCNVVTIAGEQNVSQQLLDQSPVNFDSVVFGDLEADYNRALNQQVLSGSGSSGQLRGLRNVSGIHSVTVSTADAVGLYKSVANGISQVGGSIYRPPTHVVLHNRRWADLLASEDSAGRPLVVPSAGGNQSVNSQGVATAVGAEGPVGTLCGLPVFLDAGIPTNLGVGTDEDIALVLRAPETVLFEGSVRVRALPERVASSSLSVTFQLWNYAALGTRHGGSIAVVDGLTPPTF